MDVILKFWPIGLFLLNAGAVWVCWSIRQLTKAEVAAAVEKLQQRDEALDAKIDAHDTRLVKAEGEITEIRADILDLPTKTDIARVEGKVDGIGQQVAGAASGVARIEGYFIERGVAGVR